MNEAEAQMRCDMYNRAHNTNLTLAEYGQLDLDQLKKRVTSVCQKSVRLLAMTRMLLES